MEALIRALLSYLSPCGLPVYLADAVPEGSPFPYLTMEAASPLTDKEPGSICLTIWCEGNVANTARLVFHTVLTQYFPSRGMCLLTDDGLIALQPQGLVRLVESGPAKGITLPLSCRLFPTPKEV